MNMAWRNHNQKSVSKACRNQSVAFRLLSSWIGVQQQDGYKHCGPTLWIDGTQQINLTGVDNDTRRIDRLRLGH